MFKQTCGLSNGNKQYKRDESHSCQLHDVTFHQLRHKITKRIEKEI